MHERPPRLDRYLVDQGLAPSREKAQGWILARRVKVDGCYRTKPGHPVPAGAAVEIIAPASRWVGRGGDKLEGAHRDLGFSIPGRICLDAGASTGGFMHYLLENGARMVIGVDVGYGQVADPVRRDGRVHLLERTNLRHLTADRLPARPDLVTLDLSFISLEKVMPAVLALGAAELEVIALIKPQFEVGPGRVGKGGVVRSADAVIEVLARYHRLAGAWGLVTAGLAPSRVAGRRGNQEYFVHWIRGPEGPGIGLDAAGMLRRADLGSAQE